MIMFDDHHDPAFRYEGLARAVFDNCDKYGDPWGYAAQDRYANFVEAPNEMGKRALSTILIKMTLDHPNIEQTDNIKALEDRVWKATTQEQIIAIINEAIAIADKLDY